MIECSDTQAALRRAIENVLADLPRKGRDSKFTTEQQASIVSIDEQTGIQALERIAPDLLPQPGEIARREYEYTRHGTLCLFGNLHVATGEILAPLLQQTRTEEDFLENLQNLVRIDRDAKWRFVTDNLNTHMSESLVRYVADVCNVDVD